MGQDDPWDNWNRTYQEVDVPRLLLREQVYADSIDSDPRAVKFYVRQKAYRFSGKFTGQWRRLSDERREVMKSTFKILSGANPIFDETKDEVAIEFEGQTHWLPIQPQLVKPFKKEIKKGTDVFLYCMYFNQHKADGRLFNVFFISEFWNDRK